MPVSVIPGDSPLILTMPHAAMDVAKGVMGRLNARGRTLIDTDWHIDRLFSDLVHEATVIRANFHRYMCNANGDPRLAGPDFATRPDVLVPMHNLDGELIWDRPPDKAEISRWRAAFHAPYQAAIAAHVAQTRALHGHVVLIDCHAVRRPRSTEQIPRLPDIGICTGHGAACDHALAAHLVGICMSMDGYSTTIHEGSRAGWTVRRFGRPKQSVHALQLEIALSTYLTEEEDPWCYDDLKADRLRPLLGEVLLAAQRWQPKRRYFSVRM